MVDEQLFLLMNVYVEGTAMQTTLRRVGNATALIIPEALLAELGLTPGEHMTLSLEGGRLVASKEGYVVREGWEEAAAAIAAAGELTEEEREWLSAPRPLT